MNILILHRVPYGRIQYERGIDHRAHQVTYFGKQEAMATLPTDLPCTRVVRAGAASAFDEACAWLAQAPQKFDRIISMSEYELLDAARLREHCRVSGANLRQTSLVRNKVLMKNAVAAAGLRTPQYLSAEAFLSQPHAARWVGKTVLKPHSGASSVDVEVFGSPSQAFDAIKRRSGGADAIVLEDFQVEAFIEGPVRHYDGLIQNGQILAMTSSEYINTCLAYMDRASPLGSFQLQTSEATRDWTSQVLAAVGIKNGSFHLEAIIDQGDPVFLEVGNRVGGADVVATFELATGLHLPSLELRVHLGEPLAKDWPAQQPPQCAFGWFVFPGHGALDPTFAGFHSAQEFRDSPLVVEWNELHLGAPLPRHITYSAHEAPLTGIVGSASPELTRAWIEQLFAKVSLRVAQVAVA